MPLCLRSRSAVPSSAFACSALYALPRQDLGSSTPSTARPSNAEVALGSAALSLQALLSGQARPDAVSARNKVGRHLWTLLSCAPHLLPSRMQPACILPLTGRRLQPPRHKQHLFLPVGLRWFRPAALPVSHPWLPPLHLVLSFANISNPAYRPRKLLGSSLCIVGGAG